MMLWTHLIFSVDTKKISSFLEEMASLYQQWGWEAISFFSSCSTRYFVALDRVAKKYSLKPVYGVEILARAPSEKKGYPVFLVAKNQSGVEALCSLVTTCFQRKTKFLSLRELEALYSRCFLLVGEEFENIQEEKIASVVQYYQRVWREDWYVLCCYKNDKPIQKIRHLVEVVSRFHLKTLAAIVQSGADGFFSSYEDVRKVFHNHLDFVEEVEKFLARIPFLSVLPEKQEERIHICKENLVSQDWRYRVTQKIISRVSRYRVPFLVVSVPVDVRQWFYNLRKRSCVDQVFLFQVQRSRLSLFVPFHIYRRMLRWVGLYFQGHIGYLSLREHEGMLLLMTFQVKETFSFVGEVEGIPLVQTTYDVLDSDEVMMLRLQTEKIWDILWEMKRMGCEVRWKTPLALRWLDHPCLLDKGFVSFRRHVFSRIGDFLRDISRTMHPFLSGPFVYMEEAFLYLKRFLSAEEARQFLLLLKRDDPLWVKIKSHVEEYLSEEEKHSFYWQKLIKEGKFLLSRRQERLRWYSLALVIVAMQRFPLEFTVACLNFTHHLGDKNRLLLYARLSWGIECLPPSLNRSRMEDSLENGKIRLGLRHVRKISQSLKVLLIQRRPYKDFFDFLSKHPQLSKKTLTEWIRMGLCEDMEPASEYKLLLLKGKAEREAQTLFDETALWQQNETYYEPCFYEPISVFSSCGLYAFEHPLDRYRVKLEGFRRHFLQDAEHVPFGVYVAVIVGLREVKGALYYEIVDETAWKRVFVRARPSFSLDMYVPYIFRLVIHEGKLEVVEVFAFVVED